MNKPFARNLNLLRVLARSQYRSSDYNSFLGVFWSFLGPLLTFLVMYFIFIDRLGRQIPFFALRLLAGIVALHFFSSVVRFTMKSLKSNRRILLSSRTPTEILILAALNVPCRKFMIELTLCLIVAALTGGLKPVNILGLIPTALLFFIFSIGLGLILSVLNALAGDVEEIWNVIAGRLLLFVCPVFYSLDMLSDWGRFLVLNCNPITPFILCFQHFLTDGPVSHYEPMLFMRLFLISGGFLLLGYALFKRMERHIIEGL